MYPVHEPTVAELADIEELGLDRASYSRLRKRLQTDHAEAVQVLKHGLEPETYNSLLDLGASHQDAIRSAEHPDAYEKLLQFADQYVPAREWEDVRREGIAPEMYARALSMGVTHPRVLAAARETGPHFFEDYLLSLEQGLSHTAALVAASDGPLL